MIAKTPEAIKCPHCGEPLGLELTSKLMDSSRMSFVIRPHVGELLSAHTVGGTISQVEKLLVAIGKDMGAETYILVEGMHYDEGEVKVDLLLTRKQKGVTKREKAERQVSLTSCSDTTQQDQCLRHPLKATTCDRSGHGGPDV